MTYFKDKKVNYKLFSLEYIIIKTLTKILNFNIKK